MHVKILEFSYYYVVSFGIYLLLIRLSLSRAMYFSWNYFRFISLRGEFVPSREVFFVVRECIYVFLE